MKYIKKYSFYLLIIALYLIPITTSIGLYHMDEFKDGESLLGGIIENICLYIFVVAIHLSIISDRKVALHLKEVNSKIDNLNESATIIDNALIFLKTYLQNKKQ